jgi:hypothetical protein
MKEGPGARKEYPVPILLVVFVIVCLTLACLSFLAFCGFYWLRLQEIRRQLAAHSGTAEGLGSSFRKEGAPVIGPAVEAIAKLVEQLAGLTEKLSKAPPPVVALVASVCYLLLAIFSIWLIPHDRAENKPPASGTAPHTTVSHCRLQPFADGESTIPGNLTQVPSACFDNLVGRLTKETPSLIFIVGHSDIRDLKPKGRSRFGNNGNLAYQRAQAVRTLLLERTDNVPRDGSPQTTLHTPSTVVLNAGANLVGDAHARPGDFESDRSVEIISIWVLTKGPPVDESR